VAAGRPDRTVPEGVPEFTPAPPLDSGGKRRSIPPESAGRTEGAGPTDGADRTSTAPPTLPRWAWIVVLLLGGAGGYLGGLGSRGLPFVPFAGGGGGSVSPTPPADVDRIVDGGESSVRSVPPETVRVGVPARMVYVQGDGQTAEAGTVLPEPFGVEIMDTDGRPVEGIEVRFQVVAGGGLASPTLNRTDASGQAMTHWQLGSNPGFHRLAASSEALEAIVTFTAIARPPTEATGLSGFANPPVALADTSARAVTETAPERAVPAPRPAAVSVVARDFAVGGSIVCMVTGSGVSCRGANDRGQRIEGAALGTRAVAAGPSHACGLDAAGAASCWGANESGQLGDGTRTDRSQPTRVSTDLRFSTVSAGVAHTCGLTHGGQLACWGRNLGGQLGDGSRADRTSPGLVTTPAFESLVSGWNHTCALTGSGAVYCWGLNREGQIGEGTRLDRLSPRQVTTSVHAVAAGSSHTCVISAGTVLCWGDNRFGQLGDGTTEPRLTPTPVSGLPGQPTAIVAGATHTCALLADGTAYCWGQNLYGQLGNGSTANAATPTQVVGGITFGRLAAGGAVTCGMSSQGTQYCWGLNQSGQLGDGSLTDRAAPTRVRS